MKKRGYQPSLYVYVNAWIAQVGSAKSMNVSAFERRSFAICDWTSLSVTS